MTQEREYQICTRCVMDTTAVEIVFDESGVCNFCKEHEEKVASAPFVKPDRELRLKAVLDEIKKKSKGEYDCIVGLSGGVDSSYIAFLATNLGLNPLVVHFDNGWNSNLAIKNIEKITTKLNLDLVTYVIDWQEFKDIQRSFFKANVIDIEMVTDHAIFASLFKIAKEHNIKIILSGTNYTSEAIMPKSWQHFKFDLINLKAIHKRYGNLKINHYPTISVWSMAFNYYVLGFKSISLLNYIDYSKSKAQAELEKKFEWEYYGGKHWESIFTKFYQSYILPVKFNVDKRKCHLSDMIMNKEVSREDALQELSSPAYDKKLIEFDKEYICKKLGFSIEEFESYLKQPPESHFKFPSYANLAGKLVKFHKKHIYRK